MLDLTKTVSWSIFIAGKILILPLAWFFLEGLEMRNEYNRLIQSHSENDINISPSTLETKDPSTLLKIISSRDLFSELETTKKAPTKKAKKSKLELRLVGSIITPGKPPIALIEDKKTKKQNAFSLGEELFTTGATLSSVDVDSVQIERNGKFETLEIEKNKLASNDSGESSIRSSNGTFIVPEEELNEALSNLPVLLSQARAIPFFRNGKSHGMRLYAIRNGSMYQKLGLKNSDIIKEINGTKVTDPSKALKLFEDLKSERSIKVGVEREGVDMNLNYEIR